jgi:hypothetical protein
MRPSLPPRELLACNITSNENFSMYRTTAGSLAPSCSRKNKGETLEQSTHRRPRKCGSARYRLTSGESGLSWQSYKKQARGKQNIPGAILQK